MIRTQIYLTEYEKKALSILSSKFGKNQSLLIREAIDSFITKYSKKRSNDIIEKVTGLWSDRDESISLESLRNSLDRDFE